MEELKQADLPSLKQRLPTLTKELTQVLENYAKCKVRPGILIDAKLVQETEQLFQLSAWNVTN